MRCCSCAKFIIGAVFTAMIISCSNRPKPVLSLIESDSIVHAQKISDTIFIEYHNLINNYKVAVKWVPEEEGCKFVEGVADIEFVHKTGSSFKIRHNYFFSDVILFDTLNGKAIIPNQKKFIIDYPIDVSLNFVRSDVPFYFHDMNFDKTKELVLVSLCKDQRFRDSLAVFALNNEFTLVDSTNQITHKEPYCYFDSMTDFNQRSKIVTVSFSGAADVYEERTFKYTKSLTLRLIRVKGVEHDSVYDNHYY